MDPEEHFLVLNDIDIFILLSLPF